MGFQSCFHMDVLLLLICSCLLSLFISSWSVDFKDLLVEACRQSIGKCFNGLRYVKLISGEVDEFFEFYYVCIDVFSFHLNPLS